MISAKSLLHFPTMAKKLQKEDLFSIAFPIAIKRLLRLSKKP